jgi:hypothetical protein
LANAAVTVEVTVGAGEWTAQEDGFLSKAIAEVPKSDKIKEADRWKTVASAVPGKDAKQCFERRGPGPYTTPLVVFQYTYAALSSRSSVSQCTATLATSTSSSSSGS